MSDWDTPPVTYLHSSHSEPTVTKSPYATTLDMTDEEKEKAKDKRPIGFAPEEEST